MRFCRGAVKPEKGSTSEANRVLAAAIQKSFLRMRQMRVPQEKPCSGPCNGSCSAA